MTTSDASSAYCWIWLPDATDPVVCGRLDDDAGRLSFTYARSYLDRTDAVPVYEPELPLRRGPQFAASGSRLPLCIDDAMPDAWGRRLVEYRRGSGYAELPELAYLTESGSDRIGALDFQAVADRHAERTVGNPPLTELLEAAARLEAGDPLDARLASALFRGTSIGGARPKAFLDDGSRRLIAKLPSSSDTYPVIQGEFVAMVLAHRCGLDAADVDLVEVLGRPVLLVERFDRTGTGARRRLVSALTILGLTAYPEGRYAAYADLTHHVRSHFAAPDRHLRELFARVSFNILCGNTDDHGRNHAAFVDEAGLTLTPAYDICPQARSGQVANQAMAYGAAGEREARIAPLIDSARLYHLDRGEAGTIVEQQIEVIRSAWDEVCDLARLTSAQRAGFWGVQFLNPYLWS